MSIVRKQIKRDGITQEDLSLKMEVSLATMKRWLNGDGVTLQNLGRICDFLGLSLSEIASQIDENNIKSFNYTDKQEAFFAKNQACFAFFDYLLKGYTPQRTQSKFNLSVAKIRIFLSELEKIGLIEWLPNDKAKLLVKGEPVWKQGGPLAQKYKPQIWNDFIDGKSNVNSSFYLHDYSQDDLRRIKIKITELVELIKAANKKSSISSQRSDSYGIFFCLRKFRWNLDQYLK